MLSENPKRQMFECMAALARALGSAHRLEMLELLAQKERSVVELAKLVRLSVANTSQHLQQLRGFGLVVARRRGKRVIYQLSDLRLMMLLAELSRSTEHNLGAAEKVLNSYFRERDRLEPISHKELLRRIRKGTVTLIDTRPQ